LNKNSGEHRLGTVAAAQDGHANGFFLALFQRRLGMLNSEWQVPEGWL
jgi:hypothetical protein